MNQRNNDIQTAESAVIIPTMLTIRQATAATRLSYHAIRDLIRNKQIRYIMVGSKYLVNLESLAEYLRDGEANA